MNVSPHIAAEDAFPSKPAIDFLNYYFCSICDRLEVSFLIVVKLPVTPIRLESTRTMGKIPLLASPFIRRTVS